MFQQTSAMPESVLETGIRLRGQGCFHEAARVLASTAISDSSLPCPDLQLRNELAITYILQHRFGSVLSLIPAIVPSEAVQTKNEVLGQLIRSFSLLHGELKIKEAVSTSKIAERWLVDMDALNKTQVVNTDIYIACLYAGIQGIGVRALSGSDEEIEGHPSEDLINRLHAYLLKERRWNDLVVLHSLNRLVFPRVADLEEVLKALQHEDSKEIEGSQEMFLFLLQQTQATGRTAPTTAELTLLDETSGHEELGLRRRLRRAFRKGNIEGDSDRQDYLHELAALKQEFLTSDCWDAVKLCSLRIAQIYRNQRAWKQYNSSLIDYLDMSTSSHEGSTYEFWTSYIVSFLGEDIKERNLLGSTIQLYTKFLEVHDTDSASHPQMQYLIAFALADMYEELGDVSMMLRQLTLAQKFAEEAQDNALLIEVEHALHKILASKYVRPAGDTEGYETKKFRQAMGRDLEMLYEQSLERGDLKSAYGTAKTLLGNVLSKEVDEGHAPSGQPWLSRIRDVLKHLPDEAQLEHNPWIEFELAHAKFESGDVNGCIEILGPMRSSLHDNYLKARCNFTLARAYLDAYLRDHNDSLWQLSYQALETCAELSKQSNDFDGLAQCHVLQATLWWTKWSSDPVAVFEALNCVEKAAQLWDKELSNMSPLQGLDGLQSKYSLRHRNEGNLPRDIFAIAFDACYQMSDYEIAWKYAERAKARVFSESLHRGGLPDLDMSGSKVEVDGSRTTEAEMQQATFVHWLTAGDNIYLLIRQMDGSLSMMLLKIGLPEVREWHTSLIAAKDDLSDEMAIDTLNELAALCQPLEDLTQSNELLILCPTKELFQVPLHALFVEEKPLLFRNPIVYTYLPLSLSSPIPKSLTKSKPEASVVVFGNPTKDRNAAEVSAKLVGSSLGGTVYVREEATQEAFYSACSASPRLLHYHGHVDMDTCPLERSLVLHDGVLSAQEIFTLNLHNSSPLVTIVGCGSGTAVLQTGDEPLGIVPAFLYAGASAVVATLWPIHDNLSGAAFSQTFYESLEAQAKGELQVTNLAVSLQEAAKKIYECPETSAPYFWAGFVLHGRWKFKL